MSRVVPAGGWVREFAALTAADGDGPLDAERLGAGRASVLRAARLAAAWCAQGGDPDGSDGHDDALLALVPALARLAAPPRRPTKPVRRAQLVTALCRAADAVYVCRRVEHASGRCLFDPDGPDADVCGRLLAAAHRCSARRPRRD